MYKKWAERDGNIDSSEQTCMKVINFSSGVMSIVDFAMIIWGSVVVFGAWASWTYEKNENLEYDQSLTLDYDDGANPEEKNFCEYTPMMTVFVILILKWVICPQGKRCWTQYLMMMFSDSDPGDDHNPLLLCVLLRLLWSRISHQP